jgi:hypothetical protein
MSQYFPGTIDPEATDGTELADLLNLTFSALMSQHSGASAPTYATAGTLWVGTANPSLWVLYVFDGAEWVPLLYMNPTTNAVSVPGLTVGAMGASILAQASRNAVLDVLDITQNPYLGNIQVIGSLSSGLGWVRTLQGLTFTAQGYSALFISNGRFRHTQLDQMESMYVRIVCSTTGEATPFQRGYMAQNQYVPYSLALPINTTPGVSYTANTIFGNSEQDSASEIDGHMYVLGF